MDRHSKEDEPWRPQDAIANATRASLVGGASGLLLSAVQNTLAKQNVGAIGVFTRFGGTTALFGMALLPLDGMCY
jgi:hypothetical protein